MVRQIVELREAEDAITWDQEATPEFVNEYEPGENVSESNILFDVGQEGSIQIEAKKYCLLDRLSDDDYYDLCDSLNVKQRDYLMHMINSFKSLIYVALSRATKLENLFMVGTVFKKTTPPNPDDIVVREMNRLRTEAVLVPRFIHLHEVPNNCIQIVSQNIRSLEKHNNTVRSDTVFIESQIILLQETWVKAETNIYLVAIPNKFIITQNMLHGEAARGKGTIIYSNENPLTPTSRNFDRSPNCPIDITVYRYDKLFVINMYRSSSATTSVLKTALDKIKNYLVADNVLLCGDFNDNLASGNCPTIAIIKQKYYLKLLSPIKPTTDNNTTIDGIFGKFKDYTFKCDIYESYCSDHKPIVVRLTPKEIEGSSTGWVNTNLTSIKCITYKITFKLYHSNVQNDSK